MTVTLKELEDWTGFSGRHIREIVGAKTTKIEISVAFRGLASHYRKQIERREKKGDQRERLASIRADKLEVERDVLKQKYVSKSDLLPWFSGVAAAQKAVLVRKLEKELPLRVPKEAEEETRNQARRAIDETCALMQADESWNIPSPEN